MNQTAITSGVLGFFVLCCLFAAQYWAYKACRELEKLNEKIDRLIDGQRK